MFYSRKKPPFPTRLLLMVGDDSESFARPFPPTTTYTLLSNEKLKLSSSSALSSPLPPSLSTIPNFFKAKKEKKRKKASIKNKKLKRVCGRNILRRDFDFKISVGSPCLEEVREFFRVGKADKRIAFT